MQNLDTVAGQAAFLVDVATPGHVVTEEQARAIRIAAILLFQMGEISALTNRMRAGIEIDATYPPIATLAQPVTPALVRQYPEYFITGPGKDRAAATLCEHSYGLLDSCPNCP